jgi:hypothetical protein
MNTDRLILLKGLIDKRLNSLRDWKANYSFVSTNLSLAVAVFAALNTFSIAMAQVEGQKCFNILALLVSGLITILSAVEASTKPKQKFFYNAEALNEIYDIKSRLDWRENDKSQPITVEEIEEFFKEFRRVEKSFFASLYSIDAESHQNAVQRPEIKAIADAKTAIEANLPESQSEQ